MVDLSTLRVGDTVVFRLGKTHQVTGINNYSNEFYPFAIETTSGFIGTFKENGKYYEDRKSNHDIVQIIPAEPVFTPATDACVLIPNSQPSVAECDDVQWRVDLGADPQYCRVVSEPMQTEALRFNQGKTPYGNLPLDLLDGAARVMAKGEAKYSRANYRKGYSDLLSPVHSLLRHAAALQAALEQGQTEEGGPMYDAETGECHAHHVITSALLLVQAMRVKGLKV